MNDNPPRVATSYDLSKAKPATLLDRFVARMIDDILLFLVNISVVIVVISIAVKLSGGNDLSDSTQVVISMVGGLVGGCVYYGYFVYCESRRGRTLGKVIMKLRTIAPDDGLPTTEQAARRNVFMAAPFLVVVPGIGALLGWIILLTASMSIALGIHADQLRRQAWHDHFAGGTRVVKVP